MKTGFSLLEILHRENPVFITGLGLQCTLSPWCLTTRATPTLTSGPSGDPVRPELFKGSSQENLITQLALPLSQKCDYALDSAREI